MRPDRPEPRLPGKPEIITPGERPAPGAADHRTPPCIPGHAHNPAAILCTSDCTETAGSCWGFALVYSGNFLIEAQRADAGQRLVMGIHPYHFHWQLEPGASFAAPEAAMVYSDQGLGEMSRRFHNAIRTRLLPPRWQDMKAPRPVLLNSWEACYFDFDEAKLLALAGAARQADIDLFVLDDGWFKGCNGTASSLGDWLRTGPSCPTACPACAPNSTPWTWAWAFGSSQRRSAPTAICTAPTRTGPLRCRAASPARSVTSTTWT